MVVLLVIKKVWLALRFRQGQLRMGRVDDAKVVTDASIFCTSLHSCDFLFV